MVKRHLSRLVSPKTWPVQRKGLKWITRPNPGPHTLKNCIPLNLVVKDLLKYAKTTREVKKILNEGKILIDKKLRKDPKFPLGLMDVLEIPATKEYFRVWYTSKGKFTLVKLSAEEAQLKPMKIVGKKILKGKKIQLNFYDGTNMIIPKDSYKVGDTLIISLGGKKATIKKHVKFERGALVYIAEGKYRGLAGNIEDIKEIFRNPTIKVKSKDRTFETSKRFAFVLDRSISLGEKK